MIDFFHTGGFSLNTDNTAGGVEGRDSGYDDGEIACKLDLADYAWAPQKTLICGFL